MDPVATWTVVIPVKALPAAKSRLAVGAPAALALAFLRDTLAAVLATPAVARVVVVTSDETVTQVARDLGALVVDDSLHPGINAAARHGAESAIPGTATAVVVSDLPCLRPETLTIALGAAGLHPCAFLADLEGIGTTMWFGGVDAPVAPRFGRDSRAAHADSGAVDLVAAHPDLAEPLTAARLDIDTADALEHARAVGVGAATAAALAALGAPRT